jgi:uncharacterized protein YlzI (FlbEa/FlbD family)
MKFIEVTGPEGQPVTISVDHILTISAERAMARTSITLAGGSQFAPSRVLATESYQDVLDKVMLD